MTRKGLLSNPVPKIDDELEEHHHSEDHAAPDGKKGKNISDMMPPAESGGGGSRCYNHYQILQGWSDAGRIDDSLFVHCLSRN